VRVHSADLDQVRRLLFPELSPTEGWERIESAIRGAADPVKQDAIEALATRNPLVVFEPVADG
jgi:hypothetical protein